MIINVNNITWACSPRVGWTGERININKKVLVATKVQQDKMGYNVESGIDVHMDRS